MSRTLKIIYLAALAEMALVLAGALAWRWDALSHLAALAARERRGLIGGLSGIASCLLWGGAALVLTRRQLARRDLSLAPDHRQIAETSMGAGVIFVVAYQAWIAAGVASGAPPGREFALRLLLAVAGAFVAVHGNFSAKASPPSGPRAPDVAAWTRGMLRNGWAMVLLGVLQMACALFAPIRMIPLISIGLIAPACIAISLAQRRLLRSGAPVAR